MDEADSDDCSLYSDRLNYNTPVKLQVTAKEGLEYLDQKVEKYQEWMKWYTEPDCPEWFKSYRKKVPFSVVKNNMLQAANKRKKFIS